MQNFDQLKHAVEDFCVLDEKAIERLGIYYNRLVEWNKKINLTAITDFEGVLEKHFYDSLLLFKNIKVNKNAKIIDVGTGAGFPGVVLKIARPDLQITLLDGLNKRLVFLSELLKELDLECKIVHLRAEDGGADQLYREKFDFATARAVARLNLLAEYLLPFVKIGGSFVAMKGPTAVEEIEEAKSAIRILGGEKPKIYTENLQDGSERVFLDIKKIAHTPKNYPRPHAKIVKKPL